eukprot:COSAG01_NODE_7414_length_3217_cov_5.343489_1_plen_802_part_00
MRHGLRAPSEMGEAGAEAEEGKEEVSAPSGETEREDEGGPAAGGAAGGAAAALVWLDGYPALVERVRGAVEGSQARLSDVFRVAMDAHASQRLHSCSLQFAFALLQLHVSAGAVHHYFGAHISRTGAISGRGVAAALCCDDQPPAAAAAARGRSSAAAAIDTSLPTAPVPEAVARAAAITAQCGRLRRSLYSSIRSARGSSSPDSAISDEPAATSEATDNTSSRHALTSVSPSDHRATTEIRAAPHKSSSSGGIGHDGSGSAPGSMFGAHDGTGAHRSSMLPTDMSAMPSVAPPPSPSPSLSASSVPHAAAASGGCRDRLEALWHVQVQARFELAWGLRAVHGVRHPPELTGLSQRTMAQLFDSQSSRQQQQQQQQRQRRRRCTRGAAWAAFLPALLCDPPPRDSATAGSVGGSSTETGAATLARLAAAAGVPLPDDRDAASGAGSLLTPEAAAALVQPGVSVADVLSSCAMQPAYVAPPVAAAPAKPCWPEGSGARLGAAEAIGLVTSSSIAHSDDADSLSVESLETTQLSGTEAEVNCFDVAVGTAGGGGGGGGGGGSSAWEEEMAQWESSMPGAVGAALPAATADWQRSASPTDSSSSTDDSGGGGDNEVESAAAPGAGRQRQEVREPEDQEDEEDEPAKEQETGQRPNRPHAVRRQPARPAAAAHHHHPVKAHATAAAAAAAAAAATNRHHGAAAQLLQTRRRPGSARATAEQGGPPPPPATRPQRRGRPSSAPPVRASAAMAEAAADPCVISESSPTTEPEEVRLAIASLCAQCPRGCLRGPYSDAYMRACTGGCG